MQTLIKKTRPMGGDRLHARHYTRRRHSHTGLKNSRTSTPPVHSGSLPVRKAGLQLCFGHETSREIFLQRGDKLRYLLPRNPLPMKVKLQPVGCLAHCQTNWSSGRWRCRHSYMNTPLTLPLLVQLRDRTSGSWDWENHHKMSCYRLGTLILLLHKQ